MFRQLLAGLVAACCAAACSDARSLPTESAITASAAQAGAGVTASALWNQRTRAIISRRGGSSNFAARTFALVSVAQFDAVIAAGNARNGGERPSLAGAAAAASAAVLAALYPAEQSYIDARYAEDAAFYPTLPRERGSDFAAGAALGRSVAAEVIAYAATDGAGAPWDGTTGPGGWIPNSLPPQDATWGSVRPWLMTSATQFHPADPPAVGSQEYLDQLSEVRYYSDNRTPEQLAIARYWASGYGAGGPAGFFGSVAANLARRAKMDEHRASRMFAVMHMAVMDASIGCYQAKYEYWYIRPYQADPGITVASGVSKPNFPSYPSAHSCLSSAAAGVLASFFPSSAPELRDMVIEAGWSRIYAGLHFRFDIDAGQQLGYGVAALALAKAPDGRRAILLP